MYNVQKTIKTYGMTTEQAELAEKAYQNRNTEVGYQAYYDLCVLTVDNELNDSILSDLSADFAWDERLTNSINTIAKQNNRLDLVIETV